MKDMKMKTKMIIGFCVPVILIIINVILGISSISNISGKVAETQKEESADIQNTLKEIGADKSQRC